MFNFLNRNKKFVPLNKELRGYFENNFLWLMQTYPQPPIEDRRILLPIKRDFPFQWDKTEEDCAYEALGIICENMQIDPAKVTLDFFSNGPTEIDMGTSVIFMQADPDSMQAGGLYHGEQLDGSFQISLEQSLLESPNSLIATLAHELAHVKLLGEKKIEENDEMLTDFATVFFGLGIFNANTAFQFYNQTDRWGYRNAGYLNIDEWAYALALSAFVRNEDNPEWGAYLTKTIKGDFEKCLRYMIENEDQVFSLLDDEG